MGTVGVTGKGHDGHAGARRLECGAEVGGESSALGETGLPARHRVADDPMPQTGSYRLASAAGKIPP